MAYATVETIIKAAIGESHKLYDNIPDSFIQQAVYFYNASEPFIWRKWPWHNRKVDEITATPDGNGIIVFDGSNSDVDVVRAVKYADPGSSEDSEVLVWNQDDIRAAIDGESIGSDKFQYLSDDSNGNRRIKINVDDDVESVKVLAFRRFVQAEVNDSYDVASPSATPSDYRVLTWKIDRAQAALIAYIADALRKWKGQDGTGTWNHALNGTIKDLREQEATEQVIAPSAGNFGEQDNWW